MYVCMYVCMYVTLRNVTLQECGNGCGYVCLIFITSKLICTIGIIMHCIAHIPYKQVYFEGINIRSFRGLGMNRELTLKPRI